MLCRPPSEQLASHASRPAYQSCNSAICKGAASAGPVDCLARRLPSLLTSTSLIHLKTQMRSFEMLNAPLVRRRGRSPGSKGGRPE